MKKKFFSHTNTFRGVLSTGVMLLSVSLLAMTILEGNGTMVDEYFGTHRTKIVTDPDAHLYEKYVPETILTKGKLNADKTALIRDGYNTTLGEEGTVLLKNDGVLPFNGVSKVSILGNFSKNYGSYLKTALEAKGISVNPTAITAYSSSKNNGSISNPLNSNLSAWSDKQEQYYNQTDPETLDTNKFSAHESTFDELESAKSGFKSSLSNYNDCAIIFVGRISAEGADYNGSSTSVKSTSDACRNPLALTDGEKALITNAKTYFNKIVVLVATSNMMELGWLKDNTNVNGILYSCLDSNFGSGGYEKVVRTGIMAGIANVLTGDANPSGALNNIASSNSLSSPACMNIGSYRYTNASDIKIYDSKASKGSNEGRADIACTKTKATDPGYTNYIIEAEGIYTGYKYYETRYYDCVYNQGNAKSSTGIYDSTTGNWNYTEEVDYGFGYGLSYTTWTREITDITFTSPNTQNNVHYADVKVKVTNAGTKAGKTSVQIYAQAPYTDYDKVNNVEKASVNLVGLKKTDTVKAGESVDVTVRVDLSLVASYDYSTAKTYIMDNSPDYYFATGNGAHDALNNILALQGKSTSDGMDYNGVSTAAKKWSWGTGSGTVDAETFATSKNGTTITNQFDSANLSYYGSTNLDVTYLSRKDWQGTYPISYTGLTANAEMLKYLNGTKGNCPEPSTTKKPTFDKATDLKFADLAFKSYDDEKWSELIDSLSLEETIKFAYMGGRDFAGLSCGFLTGTYANNGNTPYVAEDSNAPWVPEGATAASYNFAIPTLKYGILACSFSPELAKDCGEILGLASILNEVPIAWNPGLNTLRTPYNGRAAFYMSEDNVLTGLLGLEVCEGAREYGCVMAVKHFAFNDQELGRCGLSVYMNEQKAREGDMRAFQIPVEGGTYRDSDSSAGTMGMMISFTKLGAIDCTANYNLLHNVLQTEWGYHGYAVTDLLDDLDLGPQTFKAGITGYDVRQQTDASGNTYYDCEQFYDSQEYQTDYDLQNAIKEATKRELWVFANSNLMNRIDRSSYSVWNLTWWRLAYIIAISASGVIGATGIVLYAISLTKSGKGKKPEDDEVAAKEE